MSIRIISLILTLPLPPSFSCSLVDDMIERDTSLSVCVSFARCNASLSVCLVPRGITPDILRLRHFR